MHVLLLWWYTRAWSTQTYSLSSAGDIWLKTNCVNRERSSIYAICILFPLTSDRSLFVIEQLFYSVFKRLIGKEIVVELKNDLALRGTLHSVDQVQTLFAPLTSYLSQPCTQIGCMWYQGPRSAVHTNKPLHE